MSKVYWSLKHEELLKEGYPRAQNLNKSFEIYKRLAQIETTAAKLWDLGISMVCYSGETKVQIENTNGDWLTTYFLFDRVEAALEVHSNWRKKYRDVRLHALDQPLVTITTNISLKELMSYLVDPRYDLRSIRSPISYWETPNRKLAIVIDTKEASTLKAEFDVSLNNEDSTLFKLLVRSPL